MSHGVAVPSRLDSFPLVPCEAMVAGRPIIASRVGGLPEAAVQLCPSTDRQMMSTLLLQDDYIDLVIPRGGEGLIRFVAEHSRIPVIKHYRGNCHVYVEETADLEMAAQICYNAKVQRPGVCNAVETIATRALQSVTMPATRASGRRGLGGYAGTATTPAY